MMMDKNAYLLVLKWRTTYIVRLCTVSIVRNTLSARALVRACGWISVLKLESVSDPGATEYRPRALAVPTARLGARCRGPPSRWTPRWVMLSGKLTPGTDDARCAVLAPHCLCFVGHRNCVRMI